MGSGLGRNVTNTANNPNTKTCSKAGTSVHVSNIMHDQRTGITTL